MTIIEHLGELRSRLFRVAIAFVVVAVVAWFFKAQVYDLLLAPAAEELGGKLNFRTPAEAIITDTKISLYVGLMVTLPFLLYQGWSFVAPAVGEMGRVFTYTLIVLASSLFLAGAAFGYYVVLPFALDFLLGWGGNRFNQIITSDAYLSFVTRFLLAFGIIFEMPAATFVGGRMGLISAPMLRQYRRHALVGVFVLAAVITPPDPLSLILMAVPLLILYEVSILVAKLAYNPPDTLPGDEEL